MPYFLLASFPNSRVKPRPSTQIGQTAQVGLLDYTQPPTLVRAANLNRTYILLENLSASTALWYVYATVVLANPTLVATNGTTGQLVLFGTQLYQKQDEGTTVNWTAVNIQDVGERINALQTASLDAIADNIYAAADSAVPVVPPVVVGVDEGSG